MQYCILAAGAGSRLKHEGMEMPKPLVPIDGKPMIGRLMGLMSGCNAEVINVIVNEHMTEVAEYIREYAKTSEVPVNLLVKTTPSSMHSFYEIRNMISEGKFILTTVDTIFKPEDFRRYVDAFEHDATADAFMAVTRYIDDEKPLYVDVDADMNVTAFSDTRSEDTHYVSGGIYAMRTTTIATVEKCIEEGRSRMRNFQRELLADGLNVKAWDFGKIIDVDHASDVAKAQEFLKD